MRNQYNVRKYSFSSGVTILEVLVVIMILAILGGIVLGSGKGCMVSQENAIRAAEKQGSTDIDVRERHNFFVGWRGCGDSDSVVFEARAKNPKGDEVDIIICAGWPFKGVTIRTK